MLRKILIAGAVTLGLTAPTLAAEFYVVQDTAGARPGLSRPADPGDRADPGRRHGRYPLARVRAEGEGTERRDRHQDRRQRRSPQ